MNTFTVTVRTNATTFSYAAISAPSCDALLEAVDAQGDTPCGITVTIGRPQ